MSYRSKIILLDERFPTGEPTVQLVSTWGRNGQLLREATSLTKTAAHSPAEDYIRTVEPEPGKSIVLIVGLGDHETYGPNRNGDGFPSEPIRGKITADEVLTKHYKSYENAHVFRHHANDDPSKAIGRVKKAFWNPYMRRVEVLEDFEHAKAPDLLEKIAAGEWQSKSMGCVCFDTRICTPTGLQPIQDIGVGDLVLTHTGQWKPVTELHRRQYLGKLFNIHTATGNSAATSEHPYAVLPATEVEERTAQGHWRRQKAENIDLSTLTWVPAEALNAGDYLITPFDTTVKETLTIKECRLLGYYGAEGHTINGTSQGIELTHHVDDTLTTEITSLADEFATSWTQRPRTDCAVAMATDLIGPAVYQLCKTHVGRYAHHKRLSLELMQQPKAQQLAFLGAYINGDGGSKSNGDYYISTCNKLLAYQLQQMGFRCGMYSKINTLRHKPSTIVDKHTVEYQVSFTRKDSHIIAPYTEKVAAHVMKGRSTGPFFVDDVVVSKIKDISVLDFDGPVYNLEVDGDNSFVAENHAVHNCRIKYDVCSRCGNKAQTRKQYCDHLKYEMGKIASDTGQQNAALNPSPNFFDSSWVIRPADRTGYMLKKVARDSLYNVRTASFELGEMRDDILAKAAEMRKASDIEKIISGEPAAFVSNLDKDDARLLERYTKECPSDTKPHDQSIVRLMIAYKPSEALGTAREMGLPLGIREMLKYFLGRMGTKTEVDDATVKSASSHVGLIYSVFSEYPRFYASLLKLGHLTDPAQPVSELTEKIAALRPQSITGDYLYRNTVPETFREDDRGLTDMVSWTDPNTGQPYTTNYGTVQKTHDALASQALKHKAVDAGVGAAALGGGALLGAGALAMGLSPKMRGLPQLAMGAAGLGLGGLGAERMLREPQPEGPRIRTDQGETISGWTEMVPKRASVVSPEIMYTRRRSADGATNPLPKKLASKFMQYLKTAEIHDELAPLLGPTLDLDKTAQALGTSILAFRNPPAYH